MRKAYTCGIQTNIKGEKRVRKGEITINNINHFIYKSPFSHPYQSGANPITTPFLPFLPYLTLVYVCVNERHHGGVIKLQGTSTKFYQCGADRPEKALVPETQWGGHSWGGQVVAFEGFLMISDHLGVVSMVKLVVVAEIFQ